MRVLFTRAPLAINQNPIHTDTDACAHTCDDELACGAHELWHLCKLIRCGLVIGEIFGHNNWLRS